MMKFKGYKIAHMSIGIIFIISSDRIIKELEIIDIEQSKKASRIIFNSKEGTEKIIETLKIEDITYFRNVRIKIIPIYF